MVLRPRNEAIHRLDDCRPVIGITPSSTAIDVETVALHETGHGLSQAHFGQIFGTFSNQRIHFAPLAVMNAAVSVQQHTLRGTDNAGHCSIWGSWPNR